MQQVVIKNCHSLGLLAWYNDEELNDIIDFVKIGNAFIENDNKECKLKYGTKFTEDDFINEQF